MVNGNIREAIGFSLCKPSIADFLNDLKKHLPAFLKGNGSADDTAQIYIYIVLHALVGEAVGSHLENGDNGIAGGSSAACCEDNGIAAAATMEVTEEMS